MSEVAAKPHLWLTKILQMNLELLGRQSFDSGERLTVAFDVAVPR